MSAAIVQDVYKKFGKPHQPFWQRMIGKNGKNGGNEQVKNGNGNGHNLTGEAGAPVNKKKLVNPEEEEHQP